MYSINDSISSEIQLAIVWHTKQNTASGLTICVSILS